MTKYTQENRIMSVETPLGADTLLLSGFRGIESISGLFEYELELISQDHAVAFDAIIGKSVTITILLHNGQERYFNGIISRFSQGGVSVDDEGDHFSTYFATMVPWMWLLTKTADSRIFQELSVVEIIEKIFNENGFMDYKFSITGSYAKRTYCVQYRETDFNFISRLLEEEGIFYYYQHEKNKHILTLSDTPDDHKPCPHQAEAAYLGTSGSQTQEDTILTLEKRQEIMPGKYTLKDYNFEIPTTDIKVDAATIIKLGPGEREIYDYPGAYLKRERGEKLASLRMAADEASITTISGTSNCRALATGTKFKLTDYHRPDMNEKEYVLTQIFHEASQKDAFRSGNDVTEIEYQNKFSCIPYEVPYRPLRKTRKPLIPGTQSAIVVGPSGEEIYTDEHARVKVQFHWDREGHNDDNSSCWIRVSQLWAGSSYGAMYIPRIGHEVVVEFEEGDPDRPIIIGRVYHGKNQPPYSLPDDKTRSTIKSDSSLGGGGSNELRFEDKKGSEEVYLHGQKDWTILIENDKNQTVGHDETLAVGHDRTKTVGNNQSESIAKNKSISVGDNHSESIGKNASISVGVNRSESVGKNQTLSVGANETIDIADNETKSIGKNESKSIGSDATLTVGSNYTGDIGKDAVLTIGKDGKAEISGNLSVSGDKKAVISIKDELTIKCGKATITLKKNGDISISGKKLNFKASSDITMKGSKIAQN